MSWLLLLLALAAGAGRALHDTMTHQPDALADWGGFWDSATSWRRKYRNNDPLNGPRFPGSTTWLSFLTDGWHLTNAVSWLAADGAVLVAAWAGPLRWWAVSYVVVRRVVFEPVYKILRKRV